MDESGKNIRKGNPMREKLRIIEGGKEDKKPVSEKGPNSWFPHNDSKDDLLVFPKTNDAPVGRKAIEQNGLLGSDDGYDSGREQRVHSDLEDK